MKRTYITILIITTLLLLSINVQAHELTTIQGYKIYQNGSLSPASISTITLTPFNTEISKNYNTNPYLFQQIPSDLYLVTSSIPNGYTVSYSVGINNTFNFVNGSEITVFAPRGGYVNIWWKYSPIISTSNLILAGTFMNYGNIYSPEIVDNKMYFGGWYNNDDYPDDAIYSIDLNNISNVKKIIQLSDTQVNDPSIIKNKMYMTYSPDARDITKHSIAVSVYDNNKWSNPKSIIQHAWLPSAVEVNNKTVIYYTNASGTTELYQTHIVNGTAINITVTIFENDNFFPINVDVQYYNGTFILLGDYWHEDIYSIGMWTSIDGINFKKWSENPIIQPVNDNIIVRTPYFTIVENTIEIWYGQQKQEWWKNGIFYTKIELI